MWSDTTRDDLTRQAKRIFEELERATPQTTAAGAWTPLVDVVETDATIEVRCDLAGVSPDNVRVLVKGRSVLLAGEKPRPAQEAVRAFHLVERSFGRFARVITPGAPFDARRATALFDGGILTVTLPKLVDRRGEEIFVPVGTSVGGPA